MKVIYLTLPTAFYWTNSIIDVLFNFGSLYTESPIKSSLALVIWGVYVSVISDRDLVSRPLASAPFGFHFDIVSVFLVCLYGTMPFQVLSEPKHSQ
jgi:hypothetical protein